MARTNGSLWVLLSGISIAAAAATAQDREGGVCGLLENREVSRVQSGRVVERKATGRTAGPLAISNCFYQVKPFVSSVSLEVVREVREQRSESGPKARWEAMFHGPEDQREEREVPAARREEKDVRPREIPNLGDEAFWMANPVSGSLYVLKGDSYLRLSVGGGDSEGIKIKRSVALARKALTRL